MAKILVVEDEIIVAWDLKETLEKLGHAVVDLAISGAEAIRSATTDKPDLVLMDIRLEGELDGIAAGDEIYHRLKIPVVYLTAHADESTLDRATKTDPFGYIIKPFQLQSLQTTIKIALQRHQIEQSDRCWLVPKDLSQLPVSDTATPICTPNGEVIGGIITFQDNTDRLTTEVKLLERIEDLEAFQLKLISQLQAKTVEHQQAIACIELWDCILTTVWMAPSETAFLSSAIQELGKIVKADYGWIAIHDRQESTAQIICEYIDTERHIYPASKVGREIEIQLYPQFYDRLVEIESWIDPPIEIIPTL